MIYIALEDLLHVAERTTGEVLVRDIGLLESAVARPRANASGQEAYPTVRAKAAAYCTRSRATTRSWMATSASP